MNFGRALNARNSGDTCPSNKNLDVQLLGASGQVVIDVAGYYQAPFYAFVSADGTIGSSSQAIKQHADSGGSYAVEFNGDSTAGCSAAATVGNFASLPEGGDLPVGYATVQSFHGAGGLQDFAVDTFNPSGVRTALPFYLTVTC